VSATFGSVIWFIIPFILYILSVVLLVGGGSPRLLLGLLHQSYWNGLISGALHWDTTYVHRQDEACPYAVK
jgi:hypothetical protein